MKALVLTNSASAVTADQATAWLTAGLVAHGHTVHLTGVADLRWETDGRLTATAWPSGADGTAGAPAVDLDLGEQDLLLMRTNPARDPEHTAHHETAMHLARMAEERGVVVLNRPDGLMRASSKLYLRHVPKRMRPKTLVSADPDRLQAFVGAGPGAAVLKPVAGTHGRDVFRVPRSEKANLRQMAEVVTRDGYAMAQAYLKAAKEGDTRLILVDGEPLEVDGAVAAVRRVPGAKDFRSNVHAGGRAAAGVMDEAMAAIAQALGPKLREDGLFLVGLDVIGGRIVEINVFSPGGLADATRFHGVDFTSAVVARLEAKVAQA